MGRRQVAVRCFNVRCEDVVLSTEQTLRRATDLLEVEEDDNVLTEEIYATLEGLYPDDLSPQLHTQASDRAPCFPDSATRTDVDPRPAMVATCLIAHLSWT